MEVAHRNWNALPVEILHKIFQEAVDGFSFKFTSRFTRVCKSWLIPAQAVLYSHVIISAVSQLENFNRTVKENPHIGEKVKIFKLYTPVKGLDKAAQEHIFDLLVNLLSCLPNLEEIGGDGLYPYLPILNALQDSQLRYLKRLNVRYSGLEKSEVSNYATCVLYLKDRIEKVDISEELEFEGRTSNEQIQSRRLYNRLHQFKNLKELDFVKKDPEEIQALEHVIGTCKSLNNLRFQFDVPWSEDDAITSNHNTSVNAISSFIPATISRH